MSAGIREGNGNPVQYSCMENSMDRGAWQAIVHGVTKSQTQLSMHTHSGRKDSCICGIMGWGRGIGRYGWNGTYKESFLPGTTN